GRSSMDECLACWSNENLVIYQTPQNIGPVRIVSIDGTRVTLGYYDGWTRDTPQASPTPSVTFVFDLISRQWVSPSPAPSPSAMPTSGPSPSAGPSPFPSP